MKNINFIVLTIMFALLSQFSIALEESAVSEEVTQILYERYQNNPDKWPALHYAISQQDIETAQFILKQYPEEAFKKTPFSTNHELWKVFTPQYTETVLKTMNIIPNGIQGPTALYLAVKIGSVELVRQLLELGCEPNSVFISSEHLSIHLVDNGHAYESIIGMRVLSPLYKAIKEGNQTIVQLLLDHGAETGCVLQSFTFSGLRYNNTPTYSIRDLERKSAIWLALENDLLLKTLISHHNDKRVAIDEVPTSLLEAYKKHTRNNGELPPLYHAILKEDEEAFLLFLQYGENPNQVYYIKGEWNKSNRNALYYASLCSNPAFLHTLHSRLTPTNPLTVKEIVQYSDEYKNNPLGWPLLHYAISQKNLSFANYVLEKQPEQLHLYTPYTGSQENLKATLESTHLYPADYIRGLSPLILAIRSGSVEFTKQLLELGADSNAGSLYEIEKVVKSHSYGRIGITETTRQLLYRTPLGEAIKLQNADLIKLLLAHGATIENVEIVAGMVTKQIFTHISTRPPRSRTDYEYWVNNVSYKSALSKSVNDEKCLRLFISHTLGNKFVPEEIPQELVDAYSKHSSNDAGLPALHHSIVSNDVDAFLLLLSYGADPDESYIPKNSVKGPGETALELALKSPNPFYFEKFGSKVPDSINAFEKLKEYILTANMDGFYRMLPALYEQSFIDLPARAADLLKLALTTQHHACIDAVLTTFSFDMQKIIQEDDKFFEEMFKKAVENNQIEWLDYLLSKGLTCSDLFLMSIRHNNLEIISHVLKYEKPSAEQIKKAIEIVSTSPKINRELLHLLIELEKQNRS